MNHRSSGSLNLRKAIIGFSNHKTAEGLTERSVDSYKRDLEQWAAYAGELEVAQITKQDIEAYLFYLRTEYVPHRFGGDTRALSPKTLRNIYITLASFFTWARRFMGDFLGEVRSEDGFLVVFIQTLEEALSRIQSGTEIVEWQEVLHIIRSKIQF
jgi:site-specific recombinase XerD